MIASRSWLKALGLAAGFCLLGFFLTGSGDLKDSGVAFALPEPPPFDFELELASVSISARDLLTNKLIADLDSILCLSPITIAVTDDPLTLSVNCGLIDDEFDVLESTYTIYDGEYVGCHFVFWYPESTVFVAGSNEVIAWYRCDINFGPSVDSKPGQNFMRIAGFDRSANRSITDVPLVQAVAPASIAGTCLNSIYWPASTPCETTPSYTPPASITAYNTITTSDGRTLVFVEWCLDTDESAHDPSYCEEVEDSPTLFPNGQWGTAYAHYDVAGDRNCSAVSRFISSFWICREPYFDLDRAILILDAVDPFDLFVVLDDPICPLVLGCPGCGPYGYCATYLFIFENSDDFIIELRDLKTGEIIGNLERTGKPGQQIVSFRPKFFLPKEGQGDRFFLTFQPKLYVKPGSTYSIPVSLQVRSYP